MKQNEDDQLWKKTTCLANQNFNLVGVERQTWHRGGGLALIMKEDIELNLIESRMMKTFEFAAWNLKIQNKELQLMGVYHPPPSKIHQHTDQMFIDEFLELDMEISVKYTNLMISGDFNIHYFNAKNDSDQFKDMIEAIGLNQLVSFLTHASGNVLDLILIEQIGSCEVNRVIPSLSFSDHISIIWELKFKRPQVEQIVKSFRNWKKSRH